MTDERRREFILRLTDAGSGLIGYESGVRLLARLTDDQLLEGEAWARRELAERFDAGRAPVPCSDYPERVRKGAERLRKEWASRGPTVRQERDRLERGMRSGDECSACGRLVKLYRRKFSALMAGTIVWLVRQSARAGAPRDAEPTPDLSPGSARLQGWVHWVKEAPDTVHRMHEISRVVQFGLAESGRWNGGAGWYRPTALGRDFVRANRKIPAWIETYNDQVVASSSATVSLRESLPGFNLEDLMKAGLEDPDAWDLRRKRVLADDA